MMLMIIVMLLVFGLCLGSFVNALVWRLHMQDNPASKKRSKASQDLSIMHGRSMCPDCKHQLAAKDLVPVLSWVSLSGKCRYCSKPISAQYPIVELATSGLFVLSYLYWPTHIAGAQLAIFVLWLLLLVGFMALTVYDLMWFLLPNRIVYPLGVVAGILALVQIGSNPRPGHALVTTLLGVAVGGGIFYLLFQVSKGKWIGGGDVKLGWLLGLVVASPARSFLFLFLAALAGTFASVPLLLTGKIKRSAVIPFGPFLIAGAIITMLFGESILHWYQHTVLLGL